MACGKDDFLLPKNQEFVSFLRENNVPVHYVEAPGNHEWDFWDTHIKEALEWLPLEEANAGISSGNIGKE